MANLRGIMFGAMASTLIASAFALFSSRKSIVKKSRDWAGKAKNIKENIFDDMLDLTESKGTRTRRTFARGALLGLFIGAGAAALITPKTGKQLRKDLTQRYQGMAEKTQDVINFVNHTGRKPVKKMARILAKASRYAKARR